MNPTHTAQGKAGNAGSFVTVMAWISLALAAMGVASGLFQAITLPLLPVDAMLQPLQDQGIPLPRPLLALLEHLPLANALSLLSSALFGVVSWGLLKRREWGRLGFIAFLAASALAGLAGAAWLHGMLATAGDADPALADPVLAKLQAVTRLVLWVGAAAIAALHGAIIWKLCTAPVRAEFAG